MDERKDVESGQGCSQQCSTSDIMTRPSIDHVRAYNQIKKSICDRRKNCSCNSAHEGAAEQHTAQVPLIYAFYCAFISVDK